jgi:hypothetical protein
MNHLLSGVALAAVLAISAPVWAQAPTSPSTPNTPPSAASSTTAPSAQAPAAPQRPIAATPAAPSAQAPTTAQKATTAPAANASASTEAAKPRRHAQRMHATPRQRMHAHNVRHWHRTHYGWGTSSDHMARQLNAQELGRIGGYGGGNPPKDSPN